MATKTPQDFTKGAISMEQKFITVKEAGKYLGVSPWTIRSWLQKGKLKKYTLNNYNVSLDLEEVKALPRFKTETV